jgi:hypothetical protein
MSGNSQPKGSREAISVAMRFHILRRDNYTCQYCGAKAPDTALHIDHVEPVAGGGTNAPANLITACIRCNIGKGAGAAKGAVDRPLTAREVGLSRKADWWMAAEHRSVWALTAYAGECPVTRALLLYLAAIADPHGTVGLEFKTISRRLNYSADVLRKVAAGLIAVGYLSAEGEGADQEETLGQIHLGRAADNGHLVGAALCPSPPECFSSVARIYG